MEVDKEPFGLDYFHIFGPMASAKRGKLHLLDCCIGSGVFISLEDDHEALAASAYESPICFGARDVPIGSFTKALMKGMAALKIYYGAFTTAQLAGWIQRNGRRECEVMSLPGWRETPRAEKN